MNAIIVTNRSVQEVRKAIGSADISYEKTGRFEGGEFLEHCLSVAKIHVEAFILDLDCAETAFILEGIRQYRLLRYDTPIIVIALDRHKEDGFVRQLGEQGIEVITTEPGTSIKAVSKALTTLLPQNTQQDQPLPEKTKDPDESNIEMDRIQDKIYRYTSKIQGNSHNDSTDVMNLELPDLPFQEKILVQERIIGTIVVAVMGVETKLGCTHFSIMIANYLNRKGYTVALVEANGSNDFAQVENAYEGIKDYNNPTTQFSINGVTYYKSNHDKDMSALIAKGYDYLILDIGGCEESDWSEEFFRANAQFILGGGSEWRQNKIRRFREKYQKLDQSNWFYCIPFIGSQSVNDIRKLLPGNLVFSIPAHADPYRTQGDSDSILSKIMKPYLGVKKRSHQSKGWIYGIIGGCVIVIIILTILLVLK